MKSSNITDTEGRLSNILHNYNMNLIESTVPQKIEKAMEDVHIRTGVVTHYYPYLDKAKVKMDFTGEVVLCKILHRYGGDMLDLYTPTAYETAYDDKDLHEPYVIPKAPHYVCVLKINDRDSKENLILGFYQNEELVGFNPAKPGNIKLVSLYEDGEEYWVKFGNDGFQYKLPKTPNMQVGSVHEDGFEDINYALDINDNYDKAEIDELLKPIVEDIEEIKTNGTGTGGNVDISEDYYNKTEVDTALTSYYTKTESDAKYSTKTDLNNNYYTKNVIDNKVGTLQDEIDSINTNVNLANYVKKSDVSFTVVNQPNGHLIFNLNMG